MKNYFDNYYNWWKNIDKYIFSLILILFSEMLGVSFIQGQIIDIDSKRPIPAVNVYVEGSNIGTATVQYGMFFIDSNSLSIPANSDDNFFISYFELMPSLNLTFK